MDRPLVNSLYTHILTYLDTSPIKVRLSKSVSLPMRRNKEYEGESHRTSESLYISDFSTKTGIKTASDYNSWNQKCDRRHHNYYEYEKKKFILLLIVAYPDNQFEYVDHDWNQYSSIFCVV